MGKMIRLDKFLADAGAGTRSEVKKFIQKGMVQVNETVIRRPEHRLSVPPDRVTLSGEEVTQAPEFVYYLLHKPAGCVSATEDARDKTVMDYVPSGRKGLFPVGRLDKDTEGLLLITDDGALAHELLSPKKHVEKTYYAIVDGEITQEDIQAMENGVDIGEKKPTLPARLKLIGLLREERAKDTAKDCPRAAGNVQEASAVRSEIYLTICEGKFHQVKRMMEAVGKKVLYLRRVSMGPLKLPENLEKGKCRPLTPEELQALTKICKKA